MIIDYLGYFEFPDCRKPIDENLSKSELLAVIDWLASEVSRKDELFKKAVNI